MQVTIIDYGSGNLRSAAKAFEHVAGSASVKVTSNPADLKSASHIVLPGVGAFGDCAAGLRAIDGMENELNEQVIAGKKPFLGICVGMQLLAEKGFENGEFNGLGWIKGEVRRITPAGGLPVPHMGWNNLVFTKESRLSACVEGDVYFVHSYAMVCADAANVAAITDYGGAATAIVEKDNVFGVQFHPEKSQKTGLAILGNFLRI